MNGKKTNIFLKMLQKCSITSWIILSVMLLIAFLGQDIPLAVNVLSVWVLWVFMLTYRKTE